MNQAQQPGTEALADAVHELRNVLAGVRGAIQVVREPMAQGMEREILAEVIDRLDHMDRLLLGVATHRNTPGR
jgi:nitrogen-specific signal transduction histidine kinase